MRLGGAIKRGSQRENCSLSRARAKGCRWKDDSEMEKISEAVEKEGKSERRATVCRGEIAAPSHDCMELNLEKANRRTARNGSNRFSLIWAFRFPSIPRNNQLFRNPRQNPRGADYSASFRAIKVTIIMEIAPSCS